MSARAFFNADFRMSPDRLRSMAVEQQHALHLDQGRGLPDNFCTMMPCSCKAISAQVTGSG